MYSSCQFQRMLPMREGAFWILPHCGRYLCLIPLRFSQRSLVMTGLCHAPGFLHERVHLWLVVRLLNRQDCHAIEGHADQRGLMLSLRIGYELFIGLLGLLPGVLEAIGPPQVGVKVFDFRGLQYSLHWLALLEQGACLFVVADGIIDSKDGHRLIPGLHAVAIGVLGL